jgi:hypothetical protein
MTWNLTKKQAERLFQGGENELDAQFDLAHAAGAGHVVRWGNDNDPESGSAELKLQDDKDRPFVLTGNSRVFEDLLDSAGIIFVPCKLVEALVGNVALVNAYTDPDPSVGVEIGCLVISIKGYEALPLKVCDHGNMYVELP